jgi:hypothetical protein
MAILDESWIRRRVFELRVRLSVGPAELLTVFQNLNDEQLVQPFMEVKLWLGMEEKEPLPAALETLVTEYRTLRQSGGGVPPALGAPAADVVVPAPAVGTSRVGGGSAWGKKPRS